MVPQPGALRERDSARRPSQKLRRARSSLALYTGQLEPILAVTFGQLPDSFICYSPIFREYPTENRVEKFQLERIL